MKKDLTEIVFILDRSGSMHGLEKDTIGGFNSMMAKQRREDGEAVVSVVLFDGQSQVIYDRCDIRSIPEMTEREYCVGGCTALLDAIGGAVDHVRAVRRALPDREKPEKTIFIITTDGMENASREYSYSRIKRMIEERQAKNWQFIFLGANIDAAAEAEHLGIRRSGAVTYNSDSVGTRLNYEVLSDAVSCMRRCESAGAMEDAVAEEDLFSRIREDHRRRK